MKFMLMIERAAWPPAPSSTIDSARRPAGPAPQFMQDLNSEAEACRASSSR